MDSDDLTTVLDTLFTSGVPYASNNPRDSSSWSSHVFHGTIESEKISTSDLILNGESVDDRLRRIEILLKIPTRNVELEQKYAKLAKLWHEYNDLLSSLELIEALKGTP